MKHQLFFPEFNATANSWACTRKMEANMLFWEGFPGF
jgi:hypothetical protein